ncbi:MAG: D-alanyl-D-alanine carboxypeptidase [Oscillospiraceae bacterium]|jgi:D-alanyl-D-alanine carboxypeptidase (penicillin-binding protein 5/6)|nr:D-alanyl-D-alanine carboxypeptidase [Oscillospiraceae bacterium]
MKRILLIVLALLLIAAPLTAFAENETEVDIDTAEYNEAELSEAEEVFTGAAPEISSPSAILVEKETGAIIFEKNADEQREPASVTKIMTILLTVEALEAEAIALDDKVVASAHAASMGGSQIYLKENERMTVHELLKATVVNSANDAAVALGEHIAGSESAFVAQMNARAAELGMTNTHFTNCTGLIKSAEHLTTARDIAKMSRALVSHTMIRDYTTIWQDHLRGGETELANTNRLIHYYDGATGLKTGFTNSAGYCLSATAERDGIEYIAVTLGDKTSNERFENSRTLLSYAFAAYTTVDARPDSVLPPIRVDLGKSAYIQPEVVGTEKILVERASAKDITKTLRLADKLLAPVNVGDEVGTLTITSGDALLAEVKIVASQSSEKLNWGEIYGKFIELLFVTAE